MPTPPTPDDDLLADVTEAAHRIDLARGDWDSAVTRARDAGISLARIAAAAGVSAQAVRNAEGRRERLEVAADQLQRGDRILAHRQGGHTFRHRGWIVKAPLGIHPEAGRPGIQLERRAGDSEDYELNLWPFTDYDAGEAVFIIERTAADQRSGSEK